MLVAFSLFFFDFFSLGFSFSATTNNIIYYIFSQSTGWFHFIHYEIYMLLIFEGWSSSLLHSLWFLFGIVLIHLSIGMLYHMSYLFTSFFVAEYSLSFSFFFRFYRSAVWRSLFCSIVYYNWVVYANIISNFSSSHMLSFVKNYFLNYSIILHFTYYFC